MTLLQAIIYGIVEGFTEFLPISSTAHLMITSHLFGLDGLEFIKTFEIAIQSGAIIAVLVTYWKKFLDIEIVKKIIAAFIPTGVIGLMLYKFAKAYLLGSLVVAAWTLAIGGIILIIFELYYRNKDETNAVDVSNLTYGKAILIGTFQALAIIPGVSRSAATIVAGRLLGMKKAAIVEFSFLLAVPTILAATALDLLKNYDTFTADQTISLLIGFVTSFIFALLSISFLLKYIRRHSFIGFGIYRIIIVIIIISFIL